MSRVCRQLSFEQRRKFTLQIGALQKQRGFKTQDGGSGGGEACEARAAASAFCTFSLAHITSICFGGSMKTLEMSRKTRELAVQDISTRCERCAGFEEGRRGSRPSEKESRSDRYFHCFLVLRFQKIAFQDRGGGPAGNVRIGKKLKHGK